jgi:hypothetical protein
MPCVACREIPGFGRCEECLEKIRLFEKAVEEENLDALTSLAPSMNVFMLGRAVKTACQLGNYEMIELLHPLSRKGCGELIVNGVPWTDTDSLFKTICREGSVDVCGWFIGKYGVPRREVLFEILRDIFNPSIDVNVVEFVSSLYEEGGAPSEEDKLTYLKNAAQRGDISKLDFIAKQYGLPKFPDVESYIVHVYTNEAYRKQVKEYDPQVGDTVNWLQTHYELSREKVEAVIIEFDNVSILTSLRMKQHALRWLCKETGVDVDRVNQILEKYSGVISDCW